MGLAASTAGIVLRHIATNRLIPCYDADEAIRAEAFQSHKAEGTMHAGILALAKARCEQSPEYNFDPLENGIEVRDTFRTFMSQKGNPIVVQIVRLFAPSLNGEFQMAEVIPSYDCDKSFTKPLETLQAIEWDALPQEVIDDILKGKDAMPSKAMGRPPEGFFGSKSSATKEPVAEPRHRQRTDRRRNGRLVNDEPSTE